MLRKAKLSDVPAINHLRLQVHENTLSDPSLVTEIMTGDAITRDGRAEKFYRDRGWQQTGHLENGDTRMELERPLRAVDN